MGGENLGGDVFISSSDSFRFGDDTTHVGCKDYDLFDVASRSSSDEDYASIRSSVASIVSDGDADETRLGLLPCFASAAAPTIDAMWNTAVAAADALPRTIDLPAFAVFDSPAVAERPDITKSLLLHAHGIDIDTFISDQHDNKGLDRSGPGAPVQRTAHNAMERERRVNLRRCFDSLRAVVPRLKDAKAPSLQILNEASQYIRTLRDEEAELVAMKTQLVLENNALRTKVSQLQGRLSTSLEPSV